MNGIIASPLLRPLSSRYIVKRVRSGEKTVAITFDDGPHPVHTPEILSILRTEKAAATFFVVGSRVERYRSIVKAIAASGHEVGGHAFTHRRMAAASTGAYAKEIDTTAEILEKYLHRRPVLFRPPHGRCGMRLLWLMMSRGMRCVLWSVNCGDRAARDSGTLARKIRETPLVGGDILLFHEYNRATVEALPEIIRDIKSRGFTLTTVSRMLRNTVAVPRPDPDGAACRVSG